MRVFATLALSCFMLSSVPALAKEEKPVDPNKKICRVQDATGSILGGKKVCHTKAEWIEIERSNDATTRNFSDSTRRNGGLGR
jgi:hypothetical protein